MSKNTSILLGDYFDRFIQKQVHSGRFSSASEVIRAALRLFEQEEKRHQELVQELKSGEEATMSDVMDKNDFIKQLHQKHNKDGV